MKLIKIKKRDGGVVKFNRNKIAIAIEKAIHAVGHKDGKLARILSGKVVKTIKKHFSKKIIPSADDIRDIVEEILIKEGYSKIAKAYILYRQQHMWKASVKNGLKLNVNALRVLERKYLKRNKEGVLIETPVEMFKRVAKVVSRSNRDLEKEFYNLMVNFEFLPNTPALMNAGTEMEQLSACFVIPVEDSIADIFNAVKLMAIIHQSGGGTGFNFSKLRPKGDIVQSTKGIASGPVSFMKVFDTATEIIKQGGKRRGASMGILRVDHPDILNFITIKNREDALKNFNLSVGITDNFMKAVIEDENYKLINPKDKEVAGELSAREVFDLIASNSWKTGDPGLIFLDEINRKSPQLGKIKATSPCGEVPLLDYESCNLGSINLTKMVVNGKIDWKKLGNVVRLGINFLDNLIDINKYPTKEIEKISRANRKIGLGVMGFAEFLIQLKIPYDSDRAVKMAESVMRFIQNEARKKSIELAKEKRSFPNFDKSIWKGKYKCLRNATLTALAPTGSISLIAGCSSGIEPLFAVSFVRDIMEGTKLLETNRFFEEIAKKRGFYSKNLMIKIAKNGSVQSVKGIPKDVKRLFVTALEIKPEWHVKVQAAFQKYTGNAISKTVNLDKEASVQDVKDAYFLAYKLKCKGVTAYRYGSRKGQVLNIGHNLIKGNYCQ